MTKVVYNACFGGFGLSDKAFELLLDLKGIGYDKSDGPFGRSRYQRKGIEGDDGSLSYYDFCEDRTDPDLITVVEKLGDEANGMCAKLRIENVPPGMQYRIDEYDGNESVMTRDDYDWKTA